MAGDGTPEREEVQKPALRRPGHFLDDGGPNRVRRLENGNLMVPWRETDAAGNCFDGWVEAEKGTALFERFLPLAPEVPTGRRPNATVEETVEEIRAWIRGDLD